ncbi:MAG: rhomboid family intramembrane serine protease [Methyloprofundus sp.]|nr:rhomboid family intramembrane serine protease [Methyloprofundus sp.]
MIIIPTEKTFNWKHTPIMLFLLVIINVMVFILCQSSDLQKTQEAFVSYQEHQYFSLEWPVFKKFLSENGEADKLEKFSELYAEGEHAQLTMAMLTSEGFYRYLLDYSPRFVKSKDDSYDLDLWPDTREEINETIQSLSYIKFGLIPDRLKIPSLLTHQFLHGGVMHLLGNMFFLVICGFAVEAALGHIRFLCFYLLSGLAGGLLFAYIDLQNSMPLVGASGAISGVMAMYLWIFRLKTIEFFYWFYIFVGYFRAPALLLLPFYIGKELYSFYFTADSNVAFMAHTGGFIAGSVLLGISLLISPRIFNQEYVEEDESIDPFQEALNKIYSCIDDYNFDAALKHLQPLIAENGITFNLAILRYNLIKVLKTPDYDEWTMDVFKLKPMTSYDLSMLNKVWSENPGQQALLDEEEVIKVGLSLSTQEHLKTAEDIFKRLQGDSCKRQSLGFLARKISLVYEVLDNRGKKKEYEKIADSLSMGNI